MFVLRSLRLCAVLYSLCILVGFVSHARAATWTKVTQFTGRGYVASAYFFNQSEGLIGFNGINPSGAILRTTDGGLTWKTMTCPTTANNIWVTDIWFKDAMEGWATILFPSANSTLWHTTDGGFTWNPMNYVSNAVAVRRTPTALVVTEYDMNGIHVSLDGGASFAAATTNGYDGLDFVDDLHGVASGFFRPFGYTTDGGASWSFVTTPSSEAWGVYGFKRTSRFLAVPEDLTTTGASLVYTSSDYGMTWQTSGAMPEKATGGISGQGSIAYVQLTTSGLYRTVDYGVTWQSIGGPSNTYDSRFAVAECGNAIFAFDQFGGVYRTLDAAIGLPNQVCVFKRDSLVPLTAAICDTVATIEYIHSPTGDSITVLRIGIVDLDRNPYTSGALQIDSLPVLPQGVAAADSIGIKFGWRPSRLFDTLGKDSLLVRMIYRDNHGNLDTLVMPLYLIARLSSARYTSYPASMRVDGIEHCDGFDTTLRITNEGCKDLTITSALLGKSSDWKVLDSLGNPLQLPITLLPGATVRLRLEVHPRSASRVSDVLQIMLRYQSHDTALAFNLASSGRVQDPFVATSDVQFAPLATCVSYDSTITLQNPSCDTVILRQLLLNSNDWKALDVTGATLRFPIVIPPGGSVNIVLEFHPTKLGAIKASMTLAFHYQQYDSVHTVGLRGSGRQVGQLEFAQSVDFGSVSVCLTVDTAIAFTNSSCDPITIDSLTVSAPFQLLDANALPTTVGAGKSVKFRIHFAPNGKVLSQSTAVLKYFFDNGTRYDTIQLVGRGTPGESIYTLTPPIDSIRFADRTECDEPESATLTISNTGCDTMWVSSIVMDGPETHALKAAADALPAVLVSGASTSIRISLDSLLAGEYDRNVRIEYRAADGSIRDTTIAVHASVLPGTRTLALDTAGINFGTVSVCALHDTVIVYKNTGCMPIDVLGWRMSTFAQSFNVTGSGQSPPIHLFPGQSDSLFLFCPKAAGDYRDTIIVLTNADGPPQRLIPIALKVLPTDSVAFRLSLVKTRLEAGEVTQLNVYPDRPVSGKGLTKIEGTFEYDRDRSSFLTVSVRSPYNVMLTPLPATGALGHLGFKLESLADMALDPTEAVLSLQVRSTLTDSVDRPITLQNVTLNSSVPDYSRCTLSARGSQVVLSLDAQCGDSLIMRDLQGAPLLHVQSVVPNPIGLSSNYRTTLGVHSELAASLKITLFDAKGKEVYSTSEHVPAHATEDVALDCNHLPSGVYYYVVTASSAAGNGEVRGALEVLR